MEALRPFESVVIYQGHKSKTEAGPYWDNVVKQTEMFHLLNEDRKEKRERLWTVIPTDGEKLVEELRKHDPHKTLLVLPAGQSTNYDVVFSVVEKAFVLNEFFLKGGRVYATCGAAYWLTETREFNGLCAASPLVKQMIVKTNALALFKGVAKGPLCPFPGEKYKVGFYSDAVVVKDRASDLECTVLLSGGGSFFPMESPDQQVQVLVHYKREELERLRFGAEFENAVVFVKRGEGAALLSMFHPYYSLSDSDAERYAVAFSDAGTDWHALHSRISSLQERIRFMREAMLDPLERA